MRGVSILAPRVRAALIATAVLIAIAGIIIARACPPATGGSAEPVASVQHYGSFANNRGWFGVNPALSADNHALQAFLDARVKGSGAEVWIGRCVRIGGGRAGPGVAGSWGVYTFHPWTVADRCQGIGQEPEGRYASYSITLRALTGDASDRLLLGYEVIGNHISASSGRYSYLIFVSNGEGFQQLVDVVGPGVGRNGRHLPAVILGEFQVRIFHGCPENSTGSLDGL